MRVARIGHGHTIAQKAMLTLVRVMSGRRPPDVILTLWYRKPWFGRFMGELLHEAMRGPSAWTVGERELMAAYVSAVQQCPF
ncbi:MAG: putative peroxidase-related enzyme [bacterium]|nr:putative peroxidase-related enzyme [bacterium]